VWLSSQYRDHVHMKIKCLQSSNVATWNLHYRSGQIFSDPNIEVFYQVPLARPGCWFSNHVTPPVGIDASNERTSNLVKHKVTRPNHKARSHHLNTTTTRSHGTPPSYISLASSAPPIVICSLQSATCILHASQHQTKQPAKLARLATCRNTQRCRSMRLLAEVQE